MRQRLGMHEWNVIAIFTRRQVGASVLSQSRQKWIEALHHALAVMLAVLIFGFIAGLMVTREWSRRWFVMCACTASRSEAKFPSH